MKWEKRNWIVLLAVFFSLFLILSCTTVYAADAPTKMRIEPSDDNNIPAWIDVFKMKTGGTNYSPTYTYQLYLPGNANLDQCYLSWDGGATVTVDGQTYESGVCPIPPVDVEKTYAFSDGTEYKIITYKGSANVTPVFIVIDESLGTIADMDNDKEHNTECSGVIYIDGADYQLTKMKGRGNATWKESEDKKPYNITLGTKINFPGIDSAKTKKWSLLAECLDRSLLGNRSGYHLAHELGIGQDTASADVWMNGEYQGCYTVTPKTDSFVTDDGFMIEQDNYQEKSVANGGDPQFSLEGLVSYVVSPTWTSSYNLITVKKMGDNLLKVDGVVDESPENMEAVAAQIQSWLQDAWNAMRSDTGYNSKGKYYTDYIDIESFAKMYLMHEYVKSYDVCAGSIFFHRDGTTDSNKLVAGPLWDLDNAMGSTYNNSYLGNVSDRRSAQGDFIKNISNYRNYGSEYKTSIYKTLGTHDDFMEEVYHQYNLNQSFFNSLAGDTAQMISDIQDSARMNHIKVNNLGNDTGKNNHYYSENTTLGTGDYIQNYLITGNAQTYWDNYTENLKTYITTRSLWFANTYYDENDPANCEHEYAAVVTPPTCTAQGYTTYTCPKCGTSYVDNYTPKIAHDYQSGVCTVCGETLLNATIACSKGVSVTVYETKDVTGPSTVNASEAHPRDGDTGLIDCSGNAQINFKVVLEDGYTLTAVTAEPTSAYKSLKDLGANVYRLTQVKGDLAINVTAACTHNYQEDPDTAIAPTCTEAGKEANQVCSRCGDIITGNAIPATGHAYGAPVYTWADDNKTVTATRICTHNSQHVETETVSVTANTTDSTCTESGKTVYTSAEFANQAFSVQTKEVTIPATGHAYGAPVYTWADDNKTVTATRTCTHNSQHVETETVSVTANTTDSTCTESGKTVYTSAEFANQAFSVQTKEVTIPATGHAYGAPVYTWADDNKTVTATRTCTHNSQHVETETVSVIANTTDPTCTMAGKTVYTSAAFANQAFSVQMKEVIIPATGHTAEIIPAVAPTCTQDGLTEGKKCSVCGDTIVAQQTVSALGHDYQEVEGSAKAATCTEDGKQTDQKCSRCNDVIAGAVIPAKGHTYGRPVYTWADDNKMVTATRTCANNTQHVETEQVATTYAIVTEPTETAVGIGRYTSKAFTNSVFAIQTKDVELSPTGYQVTYAWADDNSVVTGMAVPYAQGLETVTETVSVSYTVTLEPTCTDPGTGTWTSEAFSNSQFAVQTKEETLAAKGHAYEFVSFTWTGNDQDGYTAAVANYKCKNDASHTQTVTAKITKSTDSTGATVYTATAVFDSKTNTEKKTVAAEEPPAGGGAGGGGGGGGGGAAMPEEPLPEEPLPEELPEEEVPLAPEAEEKRFEDVAENDYFYEAVNWAADNNITSGVSENKFCPAMDCTRAQVVTFLWLASGSPDKGTETGFDDVDVSAYYDKAVAWAVEEGITAGTAEGEFSPDVTVTRAQFITMLWVSQGKPEADIDLPFTDVPDNSYYAKAVAWAYANNITAGKSATEFGSDDPCTRGQIVVFLHQTFAENEGE